MGCQEPAVCFGDLGRIDLENLTWLDDSSSHWGSRDPIRPTGRIMKEEKQDDQDGVYGVQWAGEASVFNTFFGFLTRFPSFPSCWPEVGPISGKAGMAQDFQTLCQDCN